MTSSIEARVIAQVDDLRGELVDLTARLVRIPTVNPPGEDYVETVELLEGCLRSFGYDTERIAPAAQPQHAHPRTNLVGRLEGARPRPTLHFNGHIDVVPAGDGWERDPFSGAVAADKVWGRGSSDQKAGIAASIFAIEAIRRAGVRLQGSVEQSATVDEESGGFAGVAELCDQGRITRDRTDFVVITEPLGPGRICLGHRGVYWFEVVARGHAAHGSMPALGRNAAEAMAGFITRVRRDLGPRLASRHTAAPVEPASSRQPSISLNSLHAGQPAEAEQSPFVPDRAVAVFDRRFIAEESLDEVRSEIAALVDAERTADRAITWELRDRLVVEPVMTSRHAAVVRALADAIATVRSSPAEFIVSPGTYDQKHVVRRGGVTECVAYGPGVLETAHQPNEYVPIADLVDATKVMALAALTLVGVSR
jgi:succinyl-diaminopimelate desuccinylase